MSFFFFFRRFGAFAAFFVGKSEIRTLFPVFDARIPETAAKRMKEKNTGGLITALLSLTSDRLSSQNRRTGIGVGGASKVRLNVFLLSL